MAHAIRSTQKQLNKVENGIKCAAVQDSRGSIISSKLYELNAAFLTKTYNLKRRLLKRQVRLNKRMAMLKFYGSDS